LCPPRVLAYGALMSDSDRVFAPTRGDAALAPTTPGAVTSVSTGVLPVGTRIAHFVVLGKLGQGGMGVVYRAADQKLRREVALKLLPPELVTDEATRRRFLREARTAASLTHPSIATIYEIGEDGEHVFIAMELVVGRTLRAARPACVTEVVALMREVVRGVAKAHAAGVVHRDLKPDNVMVDADGHVKILDFGIAKLLTQPSDAGDEGAPLTTMKGTIVGTPAYMAPEQALGRAVDHRADLFALGVMLYELLAGQNPFVRDTLMATVIAVTQDTPPPPSLQNADVPAELDALVLRCLAKAPDDRFADANMLLAELRGWELGTSMPTTPRTPMPTLRDSAAAASMLPTPQRTTDALPVQAPRAARGRWLAAGAMVVLLVAGVGAWRLLDHGGRETTHPVLDAGVPSTGDSPRTPNIVLSRAPQRLASGTVLRAWVPTPDLRRSAMLEPRGLVIIELESGAERVFPDAVTEGEQLVDWYADGDRLLLLSPNCAGASHRAEFSVFSVREGRRRALASVPCAARDAQTIFAAVSRGESVYFNRADADGQQSLWQLNPRGGQPRRIATAAHLVMANGFSLAVSPDGQWLTYAREDAAPECGGMCFVAVRVDGSASHVLLGQRGLDAAYPYPAYSWLGEEQLLYAARGDPPGESNEEELWVQRVDVARMLPVGPPGQLTHGSHSQFAGLSGSRDGRRVITRRTENRKAIMVAPIRRGSIGAVARVLDEPFDQRSPIWSTDSRSLYFSTKRTGHGDIVRWIPETGEVEPVYGTSADESFAWPRQDGSLYVGTIPFDSGREGDTCTVVLVENGTARPTDVALTSQWACERSTLFCAIGGRHCVWNLPDLDGQMLRDLDSGRDIARVEPNALIDVSPDGSRIAIPQAGGGVALLDVATGMSTPHPVTRERRFFTVSWAPDGRALYATETMPDNASTQLDLIEPDGTVRVLREGRSETFAWPTVSPDGRTIAWVAYLYPWELDLLEFDRRRVGHAKHPRTLPDRRGEVNVDVATAERGAFR